MNRWLSRGSVLICLISLCGIAWAMQGQTEAPPAAQPDPAAEAMKIDAKADAILRELSSFYRGLEQGTVNATAAVKVNRYGQDMTLDVDYTFSWRRPNRFTMHASAARFNGEAAPVGDYNGEAICDGEHFYLHVPMLKSYVMKEAPESFEGLVDGDAEMAFLSASGGTELQILISLLSDDPYAQLMQAASGLHYVGEEIVNEQKLHHLRVESEEVDVHLWIHRGDQPWLHRAKPDLQRYYDQMAEMAGAEAGQKAPELSFKYYDWSIEKPADDAFAFRPPEGTEKTDTFFQEPERPRADAALELVARAAPDFTLPLLGGGTLNFADLRGEHIVILDFWATWCGPCRRALPVLSEVAESYKDKGVLFYAVNVAEAEDRVRSFVDAMKYTFTIALDREGKVATMFRVNTIPQTVIIGKTGVIQAVHFGFLPQMREQLTGELDRLLRGENLFSPPATDDAKTVGDTNDPTGS